MVNEMLKEELGAEVHALSIVVKIYSFSTTETKLLLKLICKHLLFIFMELS